MAKKDVSVVVLAAGLSSRMGEANKLLLDVQGTPVIRRTLMTLMAHDFSEIVVVLGHQAELVRQAIEDLPVKVVVNDTFAQGQMTSVHTGMKALTQPTDGVMVFLSDLVLIDQEDLNALREGFDRCDTGVLVPTYEGHRGNPIILDYTQRQGIVDSEKNLGCKRLIQKHPELVTALEMQNDHVIVDMDTPDAYAQITERLSTKELA